MASVKVLPTCTAKTSRTSPSTVDVARSRHAVKFSLGVLRKKVMHQLVESALHVKDRPPASGLLASLDGVEGDRRVEPERKRLDEVLAVDQAHVEAMDVAFERLCARAFSGLWDMPRVRA